MPSKSKIGYYFERDIVNSGRALGAHIFKIPSTHYGASPHGVYDILLVMDGKAIGIECKATAAEGSFNVHIVKDWQEKALLDIEAKGGKGFILLNIRKRQQVTYVLPIKRYVRHKAQLLKEGKASISWEDLQTYAKLPRNKTVWDLTFLL